MNITGTSNGEVLLGSLSADTIFGADGNDTLVGKDGDDALFGGNGDDSLVAGAGSDVLQGDAGNDILQGGKGDDNYYVDSAGDSTIENAGEGTDTVYYSFSATNLTATLAANIENGVLHNALSLRLTGNELRNVLTGNAQDNVLIGLGGDDTLFGGEGRDRLRGDDGQDSLDGGAGNDIMLGGAGMDTYVIDSTDDYLLDSLADGNVAYTSVSRDFTNVGISHVFITGNSDINVTGNVDNNQIMGNSGSNLIQGGQGFDQIFGQAGNDTLDGGAESDMMWGGSGADTYYIDDVSDLVFDDWNDVNSAYTTVDFSFANNGDGITNINIQGQGNQSVTGNQGHNKIIGSGGSNNLDGAQGKDTLFGMDGDDTLAGGQGADSLYGGAGNDFYVLDSVDDRAIESMNGVTDDGGVDTVQIKFQGYALGDHIENLTITDDATEAGPVDAVVGNALNNVITGNNSENVFFSSEGLDTLRGRGGEDHYILNTYALIDELQGEGRDRVSSRLESYTLADNVEDLFLMVETALNGTGNNTNNVIYGSFGSNALSGLDGEDSIYGEQNSDTLLGGAGNDFLDGGEQVDNMVGGSGDDTYVVDDYEDVVQELVDGVDQGGVDTVLSVVGYALTAGIENLTLTGGLSVNAKGNALSNILTGNAGNNTLDGGAGSDIMKGGAGDDIYYLVDAGDSAIENQNEGLDDTVISAFDVLLSSSNIEHAYLLGNANVSIIGNASDNRLYGNTGSNNLAGAEGNDLLVGYRNLDTRDGLYAPIAYGSIDGNDMLDGGAGDDTLDGGAGDDVLVGGSGSDYYIVDSASDLVQETDILNGGAWDAIESSVNFSLSQTSTAGVENLILTGSATTGNGNSLSNSISGNDVGNTIYGFNGNDTVYGFGGGDFVLAGNGDDVVFGDQGDDQISGGAGNDQLDGGEGNDTLSGGAGNDLYSFYGDFGADYVSNYSANGASEADEMYLMEASSDQLWFSQNANSLLISQLGTSNSILINNWFLGANYQVDRIYSLADGAVIDASQVANLVTAMAAFAPQDMSTSLAPQALINAKQSAWVAV